MFRSIVFLSVVLVLFLSCFGSAVALPLPGDPVNGLDPTTITKYGTHLVIPPVMKDTGTADTYDIAVRQFKQQILPSGLPATTIWSYGPFADPVPLVNAPDPLTQFNYPSYTIETTAGTQVSVKWRNELVAIDTNDGQNKGYPCDGGACARTFLPHLLPVDQTLHWANPPATGCVMGNPNRTDCETARPGAYTGPVPLVTHVHGAHVDPHSDGYPEAWWLPDASNIPAGYMTEGTLYDDSVGHARGGNLGFADFMYRNDQPATTLWYHDHALGMTRSNVYAGPAGFWIVRGGAYDGATDGVTLEAAVLPGPAPVAGQSVLDLNDPQNPARRGIREIPIAIQDRSFKQDGSLYYPAGRDFFDGFLGPYIPDASSDISPIWNPEAFFNTMVVNGTTWPKLEVAPALYRFRLLNGCNSRFLNLSLKSTDQTPVEIPFYQIGAEQGFLPSVVMIKTGSATPLPGDGTIPAILVPSSHPDQALLMGLAERADVIVDFRGFQNNTEFILYNTGPDEPFGGFPVGIVADPGTTGQVMKFVVNTALSKAGDSLTTPPENLVLNAEPALGASTLTRKISLNEAESAMVCVDVTNTVIPGVLPADLPFPCAGLGVPAAPKAALLGTVNLTNPAAPLGIPLRWTDESGASTPVQVVLQNGGMPMIMVTENPWIVDGVAPIEEWEIYNFTVDAHPIHLHLVRFQVIDRSPIPGILPPAAPRPAEATEAGFKDTVIAYPGEITKVKALFDIEGLYVWHCHIVEHEDNEMMRPYVVSSYVTPGAPTLDSPSGLITTTAPSFSWTVGASVGATEYRISVVDSSGTSVRYEDFTAASVCTGGTATDTCTVATTTPLANNMTHYWTVMGFNPAAYGPWGSVQSFTTVSTLTVGAPTLGSPSGLITTTTPSFSWTVGASAGAAQYQLYLVDASGTVVRSEAFASASICTGAGASDTCTVTTAAPVASDTWHYWTVMGFNAAAYGPWGSVKSFMVTAITVPGAPTLGSPSGLTGTTTPSYTWTIGASAGATQYELYVVDAGNTLVRDEVFSAATICTGTGAGNTCTVTTTAPLATGTTYYWNAMGFNTAGFGPWGSALRFNVP